MTHHSAASCWTLLRRSLASITDSPEEFCIEPLPKLLVAARQYPLHDPFSRSDASGDLFPTEILEKLQLEDLALSRGQGQKCALNLVLCLGMGSALLRLVPGRKT